VPGGVGPGPLDHAFGTTYWGAAAAAALALIPALAIGGARRGARPVPVPEPA
jgi:hypothetical protein